MKHWYLNCPYCGADIAKGVGDVKFPEIWMPSLRCFICGRLFFTGSKEYINISSEERLKIHSTLINCKFIAQSLDRTNNEDYKNFLKSQGYQFYSLTDDDYNKFRNVDWEKYKNSKASNEATQSLYDVGILIKEEDFDKNSGGIKKEKLIENQRNYEINKKSIGLGSLAGLMVGFFCCFMFDKISPNSYLGVLGILFGFAAFFGTTVLTIHLYSKNIEKKSIKELNAKNADKTKDTVNENITNLENNAPDLINNQNLIDLKKLYKNGVLTEEEYKKKVYDIIENDK